MLNNTPLKACQERSGNDCYSNPCICVIVEQTNLRCPHMLFPIVLGGLH